jgi:hypothetical protein
MRPACSDHLDCMHSEVGGGLQVPVLEATDVGTLSSYQARPCGTYAMTKTTSVHGNFVCPKYMNLQSQSVLVLRQSKGSELTRSCYCKGSAALKESLADQTSQIHPHKPADKRHNVVSQLQTFLC